MNIGKAKKCIPALVLILFLLPGFLHTESPRQERLDMYVIIDGSPALKTAHEEALAWFSGEVIDKILQDGDRLSVWIAADRVELVFSDTIRGPESRETVKEGLKAAAFSGKTADFAGALREVAGRINAGQGGLPPYTLLLTGASGSLSASLDSNTGRLLRYSRVEEFSGWRVLRVAIGIDSRVREAAAAYLKLYN